MRVVEYYREYRDEEPFLMGGKKYVYCWGKYPDGKIDIAVYSFANDMAYDYNDFRDAMGINENTNNLQENMENSIKEKVMQLKEIQGQLDSALKAYKDSVAELESMKGQLAPEVLDAFKGQTEGAEKLKVSIDGIMVEITQESERLTTSYKDAFETALTKVNENTRKVLEQILEDSKVASKVKGQIKVDGTKVFEGIQGMFDVVKNWLDRAYNKITGFAGKAEEGIDEIEAMINNYDEMEANKYATPNMDDVESGAITEADVIKNAATKHIVKGMGGDNSVTKVETLPTSGGQSIKNAATKDIEKGKGEVLKGEKSLEEPKKENGVIKNAANKDVENGKTEGPASQNIEKQPTSGGQSIKNAATKDMAKGSGTKLSTAKPKVVSEDLDTNDGINKADEGTTEESFMKMRAGAKGKVYESEMEEEGWMKEEEINVNEGAEDRVASEVAKRLKEMGIGGDENALTAGLQVAMANPSPEAEAKAQELLDLPGAPEEQLPIYEDPFPTASEWLTILAGIITLFGVSYAMAYRSKIMAAIKKAIGKGDDIVKEYGDEHPMPTDKAVDYMVKNQQNEEIQEYAEEQPIPMDAALAAMTKNQQKEEVQEEVDEKLNEAVNRIKQILKY